MIVLENNEALFKVVEKYQDRKTVLVPTMGNLHEGHMALMDLARQHGDIVIASIFVNPIQFGENEDFDKYPRTLGSDSYSLCNHEVDYLFTPTMEDMFVGPHQADAKVSVPSLANILCGEHRPGHFDGVATIVAKFFNLVRPDVAVFGKKDYQQLKVIEQMTSSLCFAVEIVAADTVREHDGLAMSSRNQYLNEAERIVAPELYRELRQVKTAILDGENNFKKLESIAVKQLVEAGFRPDYVSIRNADTLKFPDSAGEPLVVLAAAWLGEARLIDNLEIGPVRG